MSLQLTFFLYSEKVSYADWPKTFILMWKLLISREMKNKIILFRFWHLKNSRDKIMLLMICFLFEIFGFHVKKIWAKILIDIFDKNNMLFVQMVPFLIILFLSPKSSRKRLWSFIFVFVVIYQLNINETKKTIWF